MHLVEILLPVADNEGQPFDAHKYAVVREELSRPFGGITAFTRAPAEGSSLAKGTAVHDDIIVFEVMTDILDRHGGRHTGNTLSRASLRMKSSSARSRSQGSDRQFDSARCSSARPVIRPAEGPAAGTPTASREAKRFVGQGRPQFMHSIFRRSEFN